MKAHSKKRAGEEASILAYLKEKGGIPIHRVQIARELGIMESNVDSYLSRLVKKGLIERTGRGFYQWKNIVKIDLGEENDPFKFHNIHLTHKGGWPPYLTNIDTNHSQLVLLDRERRKVEFIISRESLQIVISCTDNPLTAELLALLLEMLDYQYKLSLFERKNSWNVSNIEVNRDCQNYTMSGPNAITITDFTNYLLRAYNKHNVLRIEAKPIGHVPLSELLSVLTGNNQIGNAELARQVKEFIKTIKREGKLNRNSMDKVLVAVHELIYGEDGLSRLKEGLSGSHDKRQDRDQEGG